MLEGIDNHLVPKVTDTYLLSGRSCCRGQTNIHCKGVNGHSYIVDGEAVSVVNAENMALVEG